MSLIRRVGLLIATMVLLSLGAGVATTLLAARDTLQAQLIVKNRDNAQALALALSQQKGDASLMELVLAAQFDTGHYRRIAMFDGAGRNLFRREADVQDGDVPAWFVRWLPIGADAGVAQVSDGWRAIGRVEVLSQSAFAHDSLWRAGVRATLLLTGVGLLGALLAALGLRAIRRPLDAAVQQAIALQEGRFVAVTEPAVVELRPLARSMNTMVGRLSTMFDAQAQQVDALRRQAQTDSLTGLRVRRQFMLEVQQRIEAPAAHGFGLMLFRIEDLELLNRRLGHAEVDRLLQKMAQALTAHPDRHDNPLLGRLNGSDFALCVSSTDISALAGALMDILRQSMPRTDAQISVVAGAVAVAPGVGLHAAMAAADRALAQAEGQEPFTVVQGQCGGDSAAQGEGDWHKRLSDALEQGRVMLASYPVRDAGGALMHLDCPLRVQLEPAGAFETAASWLALATRSRMTTALDQRVVSLALSQIAVDGVERCVNLAAASLLATDFVAAVTAQLEAAPKAAAGLWIDIPEALAVSHPGVIQELTRHWHGRGVRLGLEHAGAALSGMTRLYELGLDYVRIDGRFLGGVSHDADLRRHAEGLVMLLRGVGLAIFAEGVADSADLQVLWSLGFDAATGPVISGR